MKKGKDYSKWLFMGLGIVIGVVITLMAQPQPNDTYEEKEWWAALNSSEPQLILLARPSCSWCQEFLPGLDNLKEQYGFDYVYANTDEIGETELNDILSYMKIDSNTFGTPYLSVVQDGKRIAEQPGYIPEKELFEFLKTNGFISEDTVYAPNDKTPVAE